MGEGGGSAGVWQVVGGKGRSSVASVEERNTKKKEKEPKQSRDLSAPACRVDPAARLLRTLRCATAGLLGRPPPGLLLLRLLRRCCAAKV